MEENILLDIPALIQKDKVDRESACLALVREALEKYKCKIVVPGCTFTPDGKIFPQLAFVAE